MVQAALLLLAHRQAPSLDLSGFKPYSPKADAGNYVLEPPYADAPELTPRTDVPKGRVVRFTIESREDSMYPGIAKSAPGQRVPYRRNVTVYVPANVKPRLPFLVSQDSLGARVIPTILDNMIADRRLPAMAAILMDSGGGDAQGSERGLEYDTVSGRFAEYIEREILPRAESEAGVTLTRDPKARMTMGGSSGGAAAFSMAWFHPDLYRRVLSFSGTFVNQQWPANLTTPHGAWEYHEHLIPETKRKPLRIWMHVGENDLRSGDPESTFHNWPLANVRMADVLKAKRYPYQFVFAKASGHVDGRVVNQTLPQALAWVWKDYHP